MCKPLDKLAVELATHGVDTVHLSSPQIRCRSANQSRFSECTDWRAEMWLRPLDWEGCPPILGGYVDFLTIRLHEHPVTDMLQSLPRGAANFGALFDGKQIADSVSYQFQEATIDSVLLIVAGAVAPPLRGRQLAGWMAVEVIYRMLDTFNGLVLTFPHPLHGPAEAISIRDLEVVDRRHGCCRRVGLDPLDEHAGYFGQATSYTALTEARTALAHIGHTPVRATVESSTTFRHR